MTVVAEPGTSGSEVRRVQLDVSGMTCGACAVRVERKLNKMAGVRSSVNFATRVATVDVADGVTVDELCDTVERAGYGAVRRSTTAGAVDDPDARHAASLLRRLLVAAVLFIPLADLSVMFAVVPSTRFIGWQWSLIALAAPVVTWSAWPFHRVALRNLRFGTASMETLISIGVTAATVWSLYTIFSNNHKQSTAPGVWHALLASDSIYLEVAAGVTVFVLAGRYFEARAKSKAGGALRALAELGAKNAAVLLADGTEMVIPAAELKEGQRFVVRPGEAIAADGLVVDGLAGVDISAMTGESKPVDVAVGSSVVGGTVVLDGRLVVEAAAVGPDTRFAGMVRLVEEAQAHKANAQRIADRIAGVFVPVVVVIAVLTVIAWVALTGDLDRAFSAGLAVLVIACPCALGLATPTALMVASGRGAELGIFLKGHRALETVRTVDTVVFDKTGTLTTGSPAVNRISAAPGWSVDDVLRRAAAVEAASEHAVGSAIVAAAAQQLPTVENFRSLAGQGVSGSVEDAEVSVGRPAWVTRGRVVPAALIAARREAEDAGQTVVFVAVDDTVCAAISICDAVKESAAGAIGDLHRAGLRTVLLTGDNQATADAIAAAVGITDVVAEVLPEGKVDAIAALQQQGRVVAMVGDGINDGPALAAADLGMAIGKGTDVAIGAADIILVRDNLDSVPSALGLARATMRTIRTNLWWAFGYNVAAIPIAAAGMLNPLIAGAAMALSSFLVVSNSLRLRNFRPLGGK